MEIKSALERLSIPIVPLIQSIAWLPEWLHWQCWVEQGDGQREVSKRITSIMCPCQQRVSEVDLQLFNSNLPSMILSVGKRKEKVLLELTFYVDKRVHLRSLHKANFFLD